MAFLLYGKIKDWKAILASFTERGGSLCIVIASVAFGIGVNCPDIGKVDHFRALDSSTR